MIKRITDPEEFKELITQLDNIFELENTEQGHVCDLKHNKDTIISAFANKQLLNFDVFVWASKNGDVFDSACIFLNERSIKFGVKMFVEFLWVSKSQKTGFRVFKEAVKFARSKNFDCICVSTVEKNKSTPKYEKFFEKLGFLKDSSTFIAKL